MDAKITKQRLARLLSYDWIKIIAVAVATILVWSLVFTMTATRITPAQQFSVFNYYCNASLSEKFYSHLNTSLNEVLSYEVIETTVNDLTTSRDYAKTLLEARTATSEGDVIFIPNIGDENSKETNGETGEVTYGYSYLESFSRTYIFSIFELAGEEGYFANLEKFLDPYYGGDCLSESAILDTELAETLFRTRVKKDKRFKKEEQIKAGVQDEIKRIESYRNAFIEFNEYLDAGYVEYVDVKVEFDGGYTKEGKYALNICPNEENAKNLKDYVSYLTTATDEDGDAVTLPTAQDMCVCFFKFADVTASFEYESLLYINDLVRRSLTVEEN